MFNVNDNLRMTLTVTDNWKLYYVMLCYVSCQNVTMCTSCSRRTKLVVTRLHSSGHVPVHTLNILISYFCAFLARDAFIETNHRVIAMAFVGVSVCLGRACIVIIRCTLARIKFMLE